MARKDGKEKRGPAGGRLRALLDAGDHRGAAAEARAILAGAADEAARAEAAAVLASLRPDRGVVAAGAAGAAVAVALVVWTLLAG
jgi:hypothetical protein